MCACFQNKHTFSTILDMRRLIHCCFWIVIFSLGLVSCSDDSSDDILDGIVEVKGEWKDAKDYVGTLIQEDGDWKFYWSATENLVMFDLESDQEAVVSIYNWHDEFADYADGCKVSGYYRITAVERKAGIEVLHIVLRIDHIGPYPEPEPELPSEYEYSLIAGKLMINTEGGVSIKSKEEYVNATISFVHDNEEWILDNVSAGIRGRGNSTWLWYPKKSYRIKFEKKQSLMGLPKAKSWVLLAEYRDPTDLMNAYVFELGQLVGLPFTNHNRYVELILNGKSQGLYHLTEQVQQNENRVNIDEYGGYLIELDSDDGPDLSPDATDNFWSSYYRMPVCVKNPDSPSAAVLDEVKSSLAILENAIAKGDFSQIENLLDVDSMIKFLIIQELIYNVELDSPRSMFMYKDIGNDKWHMGPLWDFDAGFDFDWSNMTTGHNYFTDYRELVMGTKPATHAGTQYRVPGFFSDLFKINDFVLRYKSAWKQVKSFHEQAWENAYGFYNANAALWQYDSQLWPIGKTPSSEIRNMQTWLLNRIDYLDNIVDGY